MSAQEKQKLRELIQANRAQKTQVELGQSGEQIAAHDWEKMVPGLDVACYASMRNEPSTNTLRQKLKRLGKQVYLPIVRPNSQMLWGKDQPPYSENIFGISEPEISQFDLGSATAILLPALCASEAGVRLGRGAGYFDRALENLPPYKSGGPIRIALIFDDEILPSVPKDEHDAKVDFLVTPTRIIDCNK